MNIAKNSKFNIKIDFDKSHDSFLYDNNTEREYLNFFGMYASLPLGYNHRIFQTEEFKNEILSTSAFKVNNCEFVSDETLEFASSVQPVTVTGANTFDLDTLVAGDM